MGISLLKCNSDSVSTVITPCTYQPREYKYKISFNYAKFKKLLKSCRNSYLRFNSNPNPRKH